jgi:hypothetical protein
VRAANACEGCAAVVGLLYRRVGDSCLGIEAGEPNNMKNSILMGALVLAMALLPSFASATTTAYNVGIGMSELYNAPGVSTVSPTLDQDQGDAFIANSQFVLDHWEVLVTCRVTSSVDCLGDIVT